MLGPASFFLQSRWLVKLFSDEFWDFKSLDQSFSRWITALSLCHFRSFRERQRGSETQNMVCVALIQHSHRDISFKQSTSLKTPAIQRRWGSFSAMLCCSCLALKSAAHSDSAAVAAAAKQPNLMPTPGSKLKTAAEFGEWASAPTCFAIG